MEEEIKEVAIDETEDQPAWLDDPGDALKAPRPNPALAAVAADVAAAFVSEVDKKLALLRAAILRVPAGEYLAFRLGVNGFADVEMTASTSIFSEDHSRIAALRSVAPGSWAKEVHAYDDGSGGFTYYKREADGIAFTITHHSVPQTCKVVMDDVIEDVEVEEILTPAVTRKVTTRVTKKVARVVCGPEAENPDGQDNG